MAILKTRTGTRDHSVVSREAWIKARKALLKDEKKLFRAHDRLKARRRALPWVRIDQAYVFSGPDGPETLPELFGDKSQLLVYHFMFGPQDREGCAHCSFWADHFDGANRHLGQRDTALVVISRAPLKKLQAFQRRMGWRFKWVSSGKNSFNFDFGVSFTREQIRAGAASYNYRRVGRDMTWMSDREGASAFYRDGAGAIYHTYSTFERGIDLLNATYNFLDLTARGRDEHPEHAQDWVDFHDRY